MQRESEELLGARGGSTRRCGDVPPKFDVLRLRGGRLVRVEKATSKGLHSKMQDGPKGLNKSHS